MILATVFAVLTVVATLTDDAGAVPSFARQTGLSCFECHTVYHELTPFGRNFKLEGYVFSQSAKPYEYPPPLAGMLLFSLSHSNDKLPSGYFETEWSSRVLSHGNDVLAVPEEANLYYAGRILGPAGGFIQGTFEGTALRRGVIPLRVRRLLLHRRQAQSSTELSTSRWPASERMPSGINLFTLN
jgi:hypothetical protein